ncbi:hypothetical protein EZ216_14095 [Ramlibacter humi]|uniref:Uncharacterized protein n=1 Tax=Ramlibacter humi TaxID=2530451 RepID=A0A4Z0BLM2_9BURK|nr:hypothetical protein EZ216_14095 [Ramlibacter humi]
MRAGACHSGRRKGATPWTRNPARRTRSAALEDLTDERIEETLKTNIFGYMYMARAALFEAVSNR